MIAPLARTVYRWAAEGCAEALRQLPFIESPFVRFGSRVSDRPGVGRFYRTVAFRYAERLRRGGAPYRRMLIAGRLMTVDVTEFTTCDLYFTKRRYEPLTTDFLVQSLQPGDVFVDVGANHGYFTLIAASRVGPSGRVYAFEPNPAVFRQLAAHVHLNGFDDRVRLAGTALSNADGEATLFVSQCATNSGLSSLNATAERLAAGSLAQDRTVRVATETFDRWYERTGPGPIAVVKIDVEGAEDRVFDGMKATLESGAIRTIVCETEPDSGVRDRLASAGYDARELESSSGFTNFVFTRRCARGARSDGAGCCGPSAAVPEPVARGTAGRRPSFTPVLHCWVCGGSRLTRFHQAPLEFHQYVDEDADLHAYTGESVWIVRCRACGFAQPEVLPALPRFFDRMYAQRWSEDWIASEFDATYKDLIFRSILHELDRRVPLQQQERRLLDVGAHAGRFLHLAREAGWAVEGIELNPRTAAYAASRTGATVHQVNAQQLVADGRRYAAVVLTDVLEHIPEPVSVLRTLAALTVPGGCISVKVPCGPSQLVKERVRAAVTTHRISLADCLVHVNHFSPRSLALALERAGFSQVSLRTGAPEILPASGGWRAQAANAVRLGVYAAARLPGAVHTPLALNLQAFAVK